jgi:hypothetical protein
LHVTVEATSGRQITVESLQLTSGVFHDRMYEFTDLGHFAGKTFIKYSNDDKMTDNLHVMTKLRTTEPATVFIVKLDSHSLPWLNTEGFATSGFHGVAFSGVRETRHKEWDPSLLTVDHFAASSVWSKTFPAGTISIPGNNGGAGSFLIFMDRPSTDNQYDSRLTAYWESGDCGVHGNDWNWGWCAHTAGHCQLTVETDLCPSGEAELAEFQGTGQVNSFSMDGCNYFYHAQYRCVQIPQQVHGQTEFVGCYVDDSNRDLGDMVGTRDDDGTNSFEKCRARCGDHVYMSLQFGGECFCSNSYATSGVYEVRPESECNMNHLDCTSHSYNCGGTWRNAIYQINHPTHWNMIAHHDYQAYDFFPPTVKDTFTFNAHDETSALFMNIGNLVPADYLRDGKYHFRLVFTDVQSAHTPCEVPGSTPSGTQEAEWTQTSWLTEEEVTGFEVISPSNLDYDRGEGCAFTGLAKSNTPQTAIDGSHNHVYWFQSVGSTTSWNVPGVGGGIPAFFGAMGQTMTLYIQSA